MATKKEILIVLTSHDTIDKLGAKTGWYLPELAHPYHVLSSKFDFVFASPKGGEAPLDPGSAEAFAQDEQCIALLKNESVMASIKNTVKLSDIDNVKMESFVAVLFPGGHGPMYDLAVDKVSQQVIAKFYEAGKVVGAVCHGPAAFVNVKLSNGEYMVKGKKVTGFSNAEEDLVSLSEAMPFMLETSLIEHGGIYEKADGAWGCHIVVDGNLVTGQNPTSSLAFGETILQLLEM